MSRINLLFSILGLSFVMSFTACSSDDSDGATGPINTGTLRLFVIDTAKVNTISATGTNETTILNKKVNDNSYIGAFSLTPDGSKFAYSEYQSAGIVPNLTYTREVRMAKADGSGDIVLFSSTDASISINHVKAGNDKVYFITQNMAVKALYSVKFDGTGLVNSPIGYDVTDVSADGNLFTTEIKSSPTASILQIIDRNGDNGAGGLFHNENFDSALQKFSDAVFTKDGKSVVIAFQDGQSIKARVIDLATKTSVTKTLVSSIAPTTFGMFLSMASDSNRGVVTVQDYNSDAPSKSYVFNLSTESATSFNNNDDNIYNVYAY